MSITCIYENKKGIIGSRDKNEMRKLVGIVCVSCVYQKQSVVKERVMEEDVNGREGLCHKTHGNNFAGNQNE